MKEDYTLPPEKPDVLRKYDGEQEIIHAINKAAAVNSLSYCDLEDILGRLFAEVQKNAAIERENARKEYEKMVIQYQKERKEQNADNKKNQA